MKDFGNGRKLYARIDSKYDQLEFITYREFVDHRIEVEPDVPIFSYTDYRKNIRKEIMPIEFKNQYQALSTWLCEQGYERTHMALMGDNSYQWLLAFQAVICSNNVAVPVDKGLEYDKLEELIKKGDVKVVFYSANYEENARLLEEKLGVCIIKLDEIDQQVAEGIKLIDSGKESGIQIRTDGEAAAIIMFTSGTTGESKGVMLSQKNIMANSLYDYERMQLHYDSVHVLPFHHIYGLNSAYVPYVMNGNTMHINQSIRYLFKDMQAENPHTMVVVPLFIEAFYNAIWKNIEEKGMEEEVRKKMEENKRRGNVTLEEKRAMFQEELSVLGNRLECLISGAAPIGDKYYQGFEDFGIELIQGYGITECGPIVSVNLPGAIKRDSVGKIFIGSEVMIDHPDENGVGEIFVRAPFVMLGYYKDEEATRKALTDGWFHTGDLGYLDEDDYIHLSGRMKNLIILSNGENVSPEELENKIMNCEEVKEVVVYEKAGKIAAQIYIDKENAAELEQAKETVRKYISRLNLELAVFKQISDVEFRDVPFARTSTNKIKRNSVSE